MIDEIIKRIENERSNAHYWEKEGDTARAVVVIMLADCDAIAALLKQAYGAMLTGKRDHTVSDNIAMLGSAFEGEEEDEEGD